MTSWLLAAIGTGARPNPSALAALAALAALLFLAWRLLLWVPILCAPCSHCKGGGKRWSGKHFRPCRWCKGTGRRVQLGRRIWNAATGRKA